MQASITAPLDMLIRGTIPRFFVSPPLHMLGKWNGESIHDLCSGLAASSSVCVVDLLLADAYAALSSFLRTRMTRPERGWFGISQHLICFCARGDVLTISH